MLTLRSATHENSSKPTMEPKDLTEFMALHGLNHNQCAKLLGQHRSQIGRWESGEYKIPLWVAQFIAIFEESIHLKEDVKDANRRTEALEESLRKAHEDIDQLKAALEESIHRQQPAPKPKEKAVPKPKKRAKRKAKANIRPQIAHFRKVDGKLVYVEDIGDETGLIVFKKDDRVIITSGRHTGCSGTVRSFRKDSGTLTVTIDSGEFKGKSSGFKPDHVNKVETGERSGLSPDRLIMVFGNENDQKPTE
jgi:transcriptional regulator with XRE-family HTH domain